MVKDGLDSVLVGYFNGAKWDADSRKFTVKKGKVGEKFTLSYSLSISKGKGDTKVHGLGIPVTVWLNDKSKADSIMEKISSGRIVMEGYFNPNNWSKDDGTKVKGNQFNVDVDNIFTEDEYKKVLQKRYSSDINKPKAVEEDNPWN